MTEVKVLCVWDGWQHYTGKNLRWVVLKGGELQIKDGNKIVATHAARCWQLVQEA